LTITGSKGQRYAILALAEQWYYSPNTCVPSTNHYCDGSASVTLNGNGISCPFSCQEILTTDGKSRPPSPAFFGDSSWTLQSTNFIGDETWARTIYRVVDVSAAAQAGDAQLSLQIAGAAPNFLLPVSIGFSLFRFTMTASPVTQNGFQRPRDSREMAVADCPNHTDDCFPSYTATSGGYPITFSLALPKGITSYLAGTSTNFGADTAANPDYIFESVKNGGLNPPSADGLSIQTTSAVSSAQVTVSSRDYGGVANLTATATLDSVRTVRADILDSNGKIVVPPACAGDPAQPFVQLPTDADCNRIADSWEGQYTNPQGGHLVATDDNEPGYGPNSPKGDGYPVSDEYRGFHYILDDRAGGEQVRWVSTDPVNKLDVFFWDPSGHLTVPLRQVLARQGTPDERANDDGSVDHFKFVYRQVNAAQANAKGAPAMGVERLNRFSLTKQAGYAVPYVEAPIPAEGLPAGTKVLGKAGAMQNDGTAILVDVSAHANPGNSLSKLPADTHLAVTVAHETGHQFGQYHPERPNCCTQWLPAMGQQLADLPPENFALGNGTPDASGVNQSTGFFIKLTRYADLAGGIHLGDYPILPAGQGLASQPRSLVPDPAVNFALYLVQLNRILRADRTIWVAVQRLHMMDWDSNVNLRTPQEWQFDRGSPQTHSVTPHPTGNLEDLCITAVCRR
jgi:hypothetical protein